VKTGRISWLVTVAFLSAIGCGDDDAKADNKEAAADVGSTSDGHLGDATSADTASNQPADSSSVADGSDDVDAALIIDTAAALDSATHDATKDASIGSDGAALDAASLIDISTADTGTGATDVSAVDASALADSKSACPNKAPFDYKCDPTKPATCPGGTCLLGLCLGPKLDGNRWKDCGDGTCGACETAKGCPADCGKPPAMTGTKSYDHKDTITIWVHGFYNKDAQKLAKLTFGGAQGCGGLLKKLSDYGVKRPCGDTPAGIKKSNHMVEVEYYGSKPAAWLSAKDKTEIAKWPFDKGALGLHRYALIVAKFARHHLTTSGAKHINFACHSMGCLVTRHLLENDLEKLASTNTVVRWATNTGVIAGARLARLYDNPDIQKAAKGLNLELSDFVLMNPDHVMDVTATWDHKLYAGNNPLLQGILMHHTAATDPKIAQALKIQLLDLNNPADEPNDGIMFTLDEYFHSQNALGVTKSKTGKAVPSTRSFTYLDHMANPGSDAAAMIAAAGLFHRRKVVITLEEVELFDDLEQDNPLDLKNQGTPPADISLAVQVRYNPYVKTTFKKDLLVHDMRPTHRSAPLFTVKEKAKVKPNVLVYSGPVFDAMKSLLLSVQLLEMDWYPRHGVKEWLFKPHTTLATHNASVALKNGTFVVKNAKIRATFRVTMHTMY